MTETTTYPFVIVRNSRIGEFCIEDRFETEEELRLGVRAANAGHFGGDIALPTDGHANMLRKDVAKNYNLQCGKLNITGPNDILIERSRIVNYIPCGWVTILPQYEIRGFERA